MTITRRTVLAAAPVAATTIGSASMAQTPTPPQAAGRQAPSFYRFKVGDFEVTAFHDGTASRNIDDKFIPNAPFAEVEAALNRAFLPKTNFPNTFTTLVVNTGRNLVAIDTGFADNAAPTLGGMYRNLGAAGIDPKQVDTVLISHFHGDHITGLRLKDGSAAYPNAQVMVPQGEWAFWMDDARMSQAPEGMRGGFQGARRAFEPYRDKVARFEPGKELVPGITAIDAAGHAPGHTAFLIASGSGRLLFLADAVNHPALFFRNPEWSPVFDMDPALARTNKRKLLDMAAAERMQISLYHAPFPATGFVAKQGDGYEFVPVQWSAIL